MAEQRPTIVKLPPLDQLPKASDSSPFVTNYENSTNNTYHTAYNSPPSPLQRHNDVENGSSLQVNLDHASPRLSSQWDPDSLTNHCSACQKKFDKLFQRRHHCRLCGRLFCHDCSNTRSLIPPSALVLKEAGSRHGDASITYVHSQSVGRGANKSTDSTILYGKGLEQRMLLARHPQRTCHSCREQLAPLQEELCHRNSNSMRFNFIDEGDSLRKLCNSPLAFTLGHEVRKAAYTLSNLLPGNRAGRFKTVTRNVFVPSQDHGVYPPPEADPCHIPSGPSCKAIDPTLRSLDNVRVPSTLLQRAKGVAVITACKTGLGFAGMEFGTGLVVARVHGGDVDEWSAPSAVWLFGCSWGALVGAQVSDHVFLLMTDNAVRLFSSDKGSSIQLGADVGVAVGPLGRSAEADIGASAGNSNSLGTSHSGVAVAPIYTYSLSKGLYAGISLDGRILMTRDRVNEKFYGRSLSAHELLSGQVATPPAAQPLYDALKRCRVYGRVAPLPALPVASSSSRHSVNPYNLSVRELETDSGV